MRSSIRTRLLAAFLVVAVASALGLSVYFLSELESYGLRKLEERLNSESLVLAGMVAAQMNASGEHVLSQGRAVALRDELARLGPMIATHVRILDAEGVALVDSAEPGDIGARYDKTPEVASALEGTRGAATRITENGRVALYVANPVMVNGRVAGVAYTSATTFSIRTLLRDYRLRLGAAVLLFVVLAFVLTEVLSQWLSAPLRDLARTAVAFAGGDHSVRVRPRGSSEIRALGDAFNEMADEVQTVMSELTEEERRKTRFVSDVSHELRTPLTAIRGAAETLLDGDVPEDDARQFLSTIVRESARLSRLANDLLTLQRIEGATGELPITRVDLGETAQHAIEGLAPLTESRGVRVILEGSAPPVLGDKDRLQQVLGNLIDNASRMTPEGGTVRVLVSSEGRESVVRVLDEGPGIAEEDIPHVFDRFYRAQASRDRSSGGAGLGLAIVSAIVRSHAGTVAAASRPEGGTAFTVRFPSAAG
ncbi:MAG: HAMP domain-containing protein [Actinobacteria bacterium]|nr:HAMP domain-containing protein [Actinomycetota bacterium]